jgi:hypothetical protein
MCLRDRRSTSRNRGDGEAGVQDERRGAFSHRVAARAGARLGLGPACHVPARACPRCVRRWRSGRPCPAFRRQGGRLGSEHTRLDSHPAGARRTARRSGLCVLGCSDPGRAGQPPCQPQHHWCELGRRNGGSSRCRAHVGGRRRSRLPARGGISGGASGVGADTRGLLARRSLPSHGCACRRSGERGLWGGHEPRAHHCAQCLHRFLLIPGGWPLGGRAGGPPGPSSAHRGGHRLGARARGPHKRTCLGLRDLPMRLAFTWGRFVRPAWHAPLFWLVPP